MIFEVWKKTAKTGQISNKTPKFKLHILNIKYLANE